MPKGQQSNRVSSANLSTEEILKDYQIAFTSRHASLIGRKEVLTGKAKFGIFGDGKEVAQVAMARSFRKGDWRSGYYRDQTFMFAIGSSDVQKFFAQLYADTNLDNEPASGGRQMNSHFSTRFLDEKGSWLNQCMMYNSAADLSPTAGQMSRLLGLAYASKLYRVNKNLEPFAQFSVNGNEVAFGTIGDASTSEGIFWEVLNAAGVLQVPLAISVWDDGYGISVPIKYQTTKESISEAAKGFARSNDLPGGIEIYTVDGWDYPALLHTYKTAIEKTRAEHVPALIHVKNLTQPQGHSTSGSHERYKNSDRMRFESDWDCLKKMREWILEKGVATSSELDRLEETSLKTVKAAKEKAWNNLQDPIAKERDALIKIYESIEAESVQPEILQQAIRELRRLPVLQRRAIAANAKTTLIKLAHEQTPGKGQLIRFCSDYRTQNQVRYNSHLYNESEHSALKVTERLPVYSDSSEKIDGSQVIQRCFDFHLKQNPKLFIIGEDVGHLGGVNTEFDGLQEKYGIHRITDTGIREATILGQGIGCALRGLRPIVDIQYLDYIFYCLQVMTDDLATLHYRSAGGQIAPVIVRTKGHRLEGIWHTGSPIGVLLHSLRGMHVCVPRNMVQAAGMYNTLLESDDPALVIEVLNGYRLKERVPDNLPEMKVPLGIPEVLRSGSDLTIVTYGACVRIAEEACRLLEMVNVSVELIDVQTLLPFDHHGVIVDSLQKTNAILFLDEDVSGGATAYMMQKVLDEQNGYDFLDAQPKCVSAKDHRGAYASDGDYYSKSNAEDVFDTAYSILHERDPYSFPSLESV